MVWSVSRALSMPRPGKLLHVTHRVTEAVPVRPRLPVMPSCTA
ncbi:hypothetical protein KOEU_28480 [Komagataeibacter europaeus]|uniref:Uncharacterized protein n=1 Tax=Komagataeibacter europaeus TaxID=33995 RepID=A0A0M0EEM3_KOMEU|nr:hypothetical protein KOEU_28480 [Komagataeibacter europaeus]